MSLSNGNIVEINSDYIEIKKTKDKDKWYSQLSTKLIFWMIKRGGKESILPKKI